MDLKNRASRRLPKSLQLGVESKGCETTDAPRLPNPVPLNTHSRIYSEPPSYTTRPLPSINPFTLPDKQYLFKLPETIIKKKEDKRISSLKLTTICDLDERFYSIVEGRVQKQLRDIDVYMEDMRNITMSRVRRGYLMDCTIRLDLDARTENKLYEKANKLFQASKQNFAKFLQEQHRAATAAQARSEEGAKKLAEKQEELDAIKVRLVELRVALSANRAECNILAKYRKYLNRMSPLWYRALYDEDYISEKAQWRPRIFPSIFFPHFDLNVDVDDNIEMVLNPVIYFETPDKILEMFGQIEEQCLNYLLNITLTDSFVKSALNSRDELRRRFSEEDSDMKELILIYEKRVTATEDRAEKLKHNSDKLMNDTVLKLMCSKETFLLELHLEIVYEQLFGESLGRREVIQMARAIEALYLSLMFDLDSLDTETVRAAERFYFMEDARIMKQAYCARVQLVQWRNMKQSLHKAFQPPSSLLPRLRATSSTTMQ